MPFDNTPSSTSNQVCLADPHPPRPGTTIFSQEIDPKETGFTNDSFADWLFEPDTAKGFLALQDTAGGRSESRKTRGPSEDYLENDIEFGSNEEETDQPKYMNESVPRKKDVVPLPEILDQSNPRHYRPPLPSEHGIFAQEHSVDIPMIRMANVEVTACPMPDESANVHEVSLGTKPSTANKTARSIVTCRYCPRTFVNEAFLKRHESRHDESGQEFPCPFSKCGITFSSRDNFNEHMRRVHGSSPGSPGKR